MLRGRRPACATTHHTRSPSLRLTAAILPTRTGRAARGLPGARTRGGARWPRPLGGYITWAGGPSRAREGCQRQPPPPPPAATPGRRRLPWARGAGQRSGAHSAGCSRGCFIAVDEEGPLSGSPVWSASSEVSEAAPCAERIIGSAGGGPWGGVSLLGRSGGGCRPRPRLGPCLRRGTRQLTAVPLIEFPLRSRNRRTPLLPLLAVFGLDKYPPLAPWSHTRNM